MAQRRLEIVIAGDSRGAEKAFGKIEKSSRTMGQKLSSVGTKMTLGVTVPLAVGFGKAAQAAADEKQEVAKLTKILKNNVDATDEQVESVENWITKTQNAVGVADSELRPALGKLSIATGDVKRAQDILTAALDISAARGKNLSSVVDALVRAEDGQTTGLSRLGIETKDTEGKMLTFEEILRRANETMGGTAQAAADTASGKMEILRLKFEDIQEQIGTALMPALEGLADFLSGAADWFNGLTSTQETIALWSAGVLAAIGPVTKVVQGLTYALVGAGGASGKGGLVGAFALLAKHPIVLLFAAIATAAFVAYQKVGWFRDAVDDVVQAFKDTWKAWGEGFGDTIYGIKTAWEDLTDAIRVFVGWVDTAIDKVNGFKNAIGGGILDAILPGGGGATHPIGSIGDALGGLPGAGSVVPTGTGGVRRFHSGGLFRSPSPGGEGLAILQDGETVLPRGGGVVVIAKTNADPYEIGREVMWRLGRV